jgi:hypothetical protein
MNLAARTIEFADWIVESMANAIKICAEVPTKVNVRIAKEHLVFHIGDTRYIQPVMDGIYGASPGVGIGDAASHHDVWVADWTTSAWLRKGLLKIFVVSPQEQVVIERKTGLKFAVSGNPPQLRVYDPFTRFGMLVPLVPDAWLPWESGAPLKEFIRWIGSAQGAMLLHAAAVGENGRGLLIAGHGGSGKSGTALAAAKAKLEVVADDYLLFSPQPKPVARRVFSICKQDKQGLARLDLQASGRLNWQGKYEFNPEMLGLPPLAAELLIGGIILPYFGQAASTRIESATPRDVFLALAPNMLEQLPGDHARTIYKLNSLASQLPAWRVLLDADPEENVAMLRNVLDRISE